MTQINSYNGGAALPGDTVTRDNIKSLTLQHNPTGEGQATDVVYSPLEGKTVPVRNLVIKDGAGNTVGIYDPLANAATEVEIPSDSVKFYDYDGSPYLTDSQFNEIYGAINSNQFVVFRYATGASSNSYQLIRVDTSGLQFAKADSASVKIYSIANASVGDRHLVAYAEYPYSGSGSSFATLATINDTDNTITDVEYSKIKIAYTTKENFVALQQTVDNVACNKNIFILDRRFENGGSGSDIAGFTFKRVTPTEIQTIHIDDDSNITRTSTPFTASVTAESVYNVLQSLDNSVHIEISDNKVDLKISHQSASALSFCHTMTPATSSPNIPLNMDGNDYTVNGTLAFLTDWLTLTKNVSNIKVVINQRGANPDDTVACGLALYEWMENEKDPQNPSNLQYMKLKKIGSTDAFTPTVGIHILNFTSLKDTDATTEVDIRRLNPNRYYYICLLYKPESTNGMTVRGFNAGNESLQQAPFVNFRTNNVQLESSPPPYIETWNYDAISVYSEIRARQYEND